MKKPSLPALFLLLALLLPLASCGTLNKAGLVSVTSNYPARPEITDEETYLLLKFQNPTGTEYHFSKVTLDSLNGPEPELVYISHSDWGSIPPMDERQGGVSLFSPLNPGKYRIRYALLSDKGETRHEFEFNVSKKEDAPPPRWNTKELVRAVDKSIGSEHIRMVITNPGSISADARLEIKLECDRNYHYGEPFSIEVFLSGRWYEVPFGRLAFIMPLYGAGPYPEAQNSFDVNLGGYFGPLPAGQYRLVKEFDPETNPQLSETIYAEFTLDSNMLPAPTTYK